MPVVKRTIQPINISRGVIAKAITNELECVGNNTLANVILQLSSLSKHAEDLFGELHRETCCVLFRTGQLSTRIDQLKQKIVQLNPTVEEVSLHDINLRKPFKSSIIKDQQVVISTNRPQAIVDVYECIEPPPMLQILNKYREDGKDSLKFYTDPGYFFELWRLEIAKDTENQIKKQKHRNKRVRQTKEPRTIRSPKNHLDDFKDLRHGPELADRLRNEHPDEAKYGRVERHQSMQQQQQMSDSMQRSRAARQNTQSAASYAMQQQQQYQQALQYQQQLQQQQQQQLQQSYNNQQPYQQQDSLARYSVGQPQMPQQQQHQQQQAQQMARQQSQQFGQPRMMAQSPMASVRPTMPPPAPPGSTAPPAAQPFGSPMNSGAQQRTPYQFATLQSTQKEQHRYFKDLNSTTASGSPFVGELLDQYSPSKLQGSATLTRVVSGKSKGRDSMDLPPPPTPPPNLQNSSYNSIPSPPLPATPSNIDYPDNSINSSALPSPPPLPPFSSAEQRPYVEASAAGDGGAVMVLPPGEFLFDSMNQEFSNIAVSDGTDSLQDNGVDSQQDLSSEQPLVRDTRSDLLSAIREGIQLRKGEERRQKSEQKQKSSGHLDVQSIMEAAFEMRRKALEENDSEDEEDDLDGNWSDDG